MKTAFEAFDILAYMAANGNPASVSDAGVGALAARSAVLGAYLNVKINAAGLKDRSIAENILAEAKSIADEAQKREAEILVVVNNIIDK